MLEAGIIIELFKFISPYRRKVLVKALSTQIVIFNRISNTRGRNDIWSNNDGRSLIILPKTKNQQAYFAG